MTVVCLSTGSFEEAFTVAVDAFVDVDDFGLIGIEVLDASNQAPNVDWKRTAVASSIHVAYDTAVDAVYVRLESRSGRQVVPTRLTVSVDSTGIARHIVLPRVQRS